MEIVPVTRKEKFIRAAIDGVPLSIDAIPRIEMYLAKISGDNVDLPDPITRIEKYLAVIAGMDVVLPSPVTRVEKYLAKIAGMDVETPDPITRIEMLLDEWVESSGGVLKTVSGAVVSVSDALKKAIISLVVSLEPIQDLHGYANPWPAGGGKNKLPLGSKASETISGVTAKLEDGVITLSGTATETTEFVFPLITSVDISPSTNKIAFLNSVSNANVVLYFMRSSTSIHYWQMNPINRVASGWQDTGNEVIDSIMVRVYSGTNASMTVSPMLIAAAETNYSFVPYSNICPISGHESVKVTRTGKNLFDISTAHVSSDNCRLGGIGYADGSFVLPAGDYVLSANTNMTGWYVKDKNGSNVRVVYNNSKCAFTLNEKKAVVIDAYKSGANYDFSPFDIQLELGSTATAYEPYTGTTYAIDWTDEAGTVYGGELDVTTGVLTVTKAMVDLGTLNYSQGFSGFYTTGLKTDVKIPSSVANSGLLSDIYVVGNTASSDQMYIQITGSYVGWIVILPSTSYASASDFKTAMSGHQLCYELATPLVIQLTPTEIQMLLGNNTLWADTGDITVTYMADGPADDVEALNILLGNRYVNLGEPDEATDREALDILLGGR